MEKSIDAQEQNEVGPITEQVFEANRLIKNLKDFMIDEGYPEEQIKRVIEEVEITNENRLHKAVCRMKVYNDHKKCLQIKAFDHLKMAVTMRKVLRYWLTFSNNRVQHVKCDLQEAFRKWANGDINKAM